LRGEPIMAACGHNGRPADMGRRFLHAGHDLWRNAEGIASDAGNQPETITWKNGRNVHVLFLLCGNSIVSADCNDRG
jgi:hypothetical protein